jgi:hypothetical protein
MKNERKVLYYCTVVMTSRAAAQGIILATREDFIIIIINLSLYIF